MIVRLKDNQLWKETPEKLIFQFYDSPIKSLSERRKFFFFSQFQFYDSPIKSHKGISEKATFIHNFNSMIVRLKVIRLVTIDNYQANFNSMIVRLKEST